MRSTNAATVSCSGGASSETRQQYMLSTTKSSAFSLQMLYMRGGERLGTITRSRGGSV
jgi:hypothetical protein